MSSDPLRSAIESIRTQLQAELDAQLGAIERQHADALDRARRDARDESEARASAEIARINAEWESRLRAALAEAAGEADRRIAAETARVRVETEQRTREAIEQARRDLAQEFEGSRADLERALQAERATRASAEEAHVARLAELEREIEQAHQRADALSAELTELTQSRRALEDRARQSADEAQALRQSVEAEASAREQVESSLAQARAAAAAQARDAQDRATTESRAAERQSQLAVMERMLNAVLAISEARSLSDVLGALVDGAAAEASRAAVLVEAGGGLQPFRASGFDQVRAVPADRTDDVLRTAMNERRAVAVTQAAAPAFAALIADRAGLAVPITVGGQAVAVLYADNGLAASPEVPASWPEAVQILCLHASAAIAHLTAVRTTQAMRLMRPAARAAGRSLQQDNDADQAARRYARLLVSEIKLYNESAVRIGREKRDLLSRLRPEIERARRLYEERVPPSVTSRAEYFDQELRQTLADGDASLLGQHTVFP